VAVAPGTELEETSLVLPELSVRGCMKGLTPPNDAQLAFRPQAPGPGDQCVEQFPDAAGQGTGLLLEPSRRPIHAGHFSPVEFSVPVTGLTPTGPECVPKIEAEARYLRVRFKEASEALSHRLPHLLIRRAEPRPVSRPGFGTLVRISGPALWVVEDRIARGHPVTEVVTQDLEVDTALLGLFLEEGRRFRETVVIQDEAVEPVLRHPVNGVRGVGIHQSAALEQWLGPLFRVAQFEL